MLNFSEKRELPGCSVPHECFAIGVYGMSTSIATRYRFARHTRRISLLTLICVLLVVICGSIALLPGFKFLDALVGVSYIVAILAFIVLLPLLYFQYSYARSGLWIEPDKV